MDILRRNNVKVSGRGVKPIVFAHGFGCDQNMWRYVIPTFETEFKVIVFDYVGSGGSDKNAYNSERYSDLNGYAQDVLEICEALNLQDLIFVGHSVSSMIGLLAALKRPYVVTTLIMVSPSPRYINDNHYNGGFEKKDILELLDTMDKNYIGWASFLAPAIMKNADRPEFAQELTDSFCSTDPTIARQFARTTFLSDNRTDLKKSTVPCFILQCSEDDIAPVDVGKYLHENLANSTLVILSASGHCPHLTNPKETTDSIMTYLHGVRFDFANG